MRGWAAPPARLQARGKQSRGEERQAQRQSCNLLFHRATFLPDAAPNAKEMANNRSTSTHSRCPGPPRPAAALPNRITKTGIMRSTAPLTRDVKIHHALPILGHQLAGSADGPPLHALRRQGRGTGRRQCTLWDVGATVLAHRTGGAPPHVLHAAQQQQGQTPPSPSQPPSPTASKPAPPETPALPGRGGGAAGTGTHSCRSCPCAAASE